MDKPIVVLAVFIAFAGESLRHEGTAFVAPAVQFARPAVALDQPHDERDDWPVSRERFRHEAVPASGTATAQLAHATNAAPPRVLVYLN